MQNFYKFFWNFSKVFDEYIFAECFPRTEILATPLQYKTWEEFMYEILFDLPLEPKFLAPPLLSPPHIRVQETPWCTDLYCKMLYCTCIYIHVQGRIVSQMVGGTIINCHCPIKLRKAWLFLDFRKILLQV